MIGFFNLDPNTGKTTHVASISKEQIRECPFTILVPEHYRHDGTCLCSNLDHRRTMIAEWEYSEEDFQDIPLKD
jgi:hypothetical protein